MAIFHYGFIFIYKKKTGAKVNLQVQVYKLFRLLKQLLKLRNIQTINNYYVLLLFVVGIYLHFCRCYFLFSIQNYELLKFLIFISIYKNDSIFFSIYVILNS